MSDSDYAPLVDDPDLTKQIGDKDYNLAYDDITGFSYVSDGEGAEFAQAGAETEAEVGVGGYPFDPSNAEEALAALAALQGMNPNGPAFGNTLEALNAAYAMGNLTDAQMQAAGLVNYNGTWMGAANARLNYAGDAADALAAGGTWGSLNQDLQRAYANVYPQDAVQLGKAAALNLMDTSVLTPQLVVGFAKVGSTWVAPTALSQGAASNLIASVGAPAGNGASYNVYAVTDPLLPATHVGNLLDIRQTQNGIFIANYYQYSTEYDTSGGNPWEGGLPWVELSKPTFQYSAYGSTVTSIDSFVGGTAQIVYVKN